jgi:hypothetical protein
LEVIVKQIAIALGAASFLVALNLAGCASEPAPLPATSQEPTQGTFQGSYTGHPNPPQENNVNGTFQGSYTGHPDQAPPKKVDTTFQGSYSTKPDGG